MKLILARYGSHDGERLTEEGRKEMTELAERLASEIDESAVIVVANITRAMESAAVLADALNIPFFPRKELYAAPEDGVGMDIEAVECLLDDLGESHKCIIAIASREYIEYLNGGKLLERGYFCIVNYGEKV